MRKVVFAINITADGNSSHLEAIPDGEMLGYFTGILRTASHILFGRVTYNLMVPYWPDVAKNQTGDAASNEFARVFESLDRIVFSTTLNRIDDKKTELLRGHVPEKLQALKKQSGGDICVGSQSIASQLSERGLIDEYHIVIHPAIAGKGPRLFENTAMQARLRLDFVDSKSFRSGITALHFRKTSQ
ncbi:MAG TPA: dihydrofolate reductase family protein [Bacteroidota bacterium]|nr:dihydrofolate reductase family protein [Bacteroidota bacterium]